MLPYVLGAVPNAYMKMSVLSVVLIPLTLAYAIVRYRLMDVDIIFRRGYAYTLATLCVLAAFYGIVFSLGSLVQKNFQDLGNTGLIDGHADRRVPVPARSATGFRSGWTATSTATATTTGARWWSSRAS